jgi:hypothetical protein
MGYLTMEKLTGLIARCVMITNDSSTWLSLEEWAGL